jgi:hypothetical protein
MLLYASVPRGADPVAHVTQNDGSLEAALRATTLSGEGGGREKVEDYVKASLAILLAPEVHMTMVSSPSFMRYLLERLNESPDALVFSRITQILLVLLRVGSLPSPSSFLFVSFPFISFPFLSFPFLSPAPCLLSFPSSSSSFSLVFLPSPSLTAFSERDLSGAGYSVRARKKRIFPGNYRKGVKRRRRGGEE